RDPRRDLHPDRLRRPPRRFHPAATRTRGCRRNIPSRPGPRARRTKPRGSAFRPSRSSTAAYARAPPLCRTSVEAASDPCKDGAMPRWRPLGPATLLVLVVGCGGHQISAIRSGALYPSKGDDCDVRFENLNFQEASSKYEHLGLVTLTGASST